MGNFVPTNSHCTIATQTLANGVYYVKYGKMVQKLIVMH